MSAAAPAKRRGVLQTLAGIEDGTIIAAAFVLLLAGTGAVLYLDWRELTAADLTQAAIPDMPVLPAFDPSNPVPPAGPAVTASPELLRQPLRAELGPGGVLSLTGTIDPGSFARVEA